MTYKLRMEKEIKMLVQAGIYIMGLDDLFLAKQHIPEAIRNIRLILDNYYLVGKANQENGRFVFKVSTNKADRAIYDQLEKSIYSNDYTYVFVHNSDDTWEAKAPSDSSPKPCNLVSVEITTDSKEPVLVISPLNGEDTDEED